MSNTYESALTAAFGSHVGLNADWSVSAWCVVSSDGPNRGTGLYIVDNEESECLTLVVRNFDADILHEPSLSVPYSSAAFLIDEANHRRNAIKLRFAGNFANPFDVPLRHSPGPWIVEHPFGEPGVSISGPNTDLIAKLYTPTPGYACIEANARLIAAAPDLFLALTALVANQEEAWRSSGTMPEEHIQSMPYLRQARAALLKVTRA